MLPVPFSRGSDEARPTGDGPNQRSLSEPRRIREATVAKLLKRNRIRRFDAEHVLTVLRQTKIAVAPGTTDAACAPIATLLDRIRLANRQRADDHRRIDTLAARFVPEVAEPRQEKQHDVTILASLPGLGRIVLARLLAEGFDARSRAKYAALRARGHSHGRALRSVADRLLNVACDMLKTGTTFNPALATAKVPC